MGQRITRSVRKAGLTGYQFGAPGVSDGISMGMPIHLLLELPSIELRLAPQEHSECRTPYSLEILLQTA
jgi:dihydroxy-acid dehydratase